MTHLAWLVPAAPAVLALLALLLGRRLPGGPAVATLLGTLVATVVAVCCCRRARPPGPYGRAPVVVDRRSPAQAQG